MEVVDCAGDKTGHVVAQVHTNDSHTTVNEGDDHSVGLIRKQSISKDHPRRLPYPRRNATLGSLSTTISKLFRRFHSKNIAESRDKSANGGNNAYSGNNVYRYLSIPQIQGIRLISLEPGAGPDPLRCCIVYTTYSESERYEAVSYVWGDPKPVVPIEVGSLDSDEGSHIMISRNCGEVLKRLRLPHRPRSLWIDSVCINQADLDEKSEEVARMDRIYANASEVAVYLGPGSFEGMEVLKGLHPSNLRNLKPREISLIKHLFRLPWFTRTWIIQEVYLAKTATVYDDQTSVPWDILLSVARHIHEQSFLGGVARVGKFPCVLELALQRREQSRYSILELMETARRCETTDARDKVYAFAGICPELTKLPFPEDVSAHLIFKTAVSFHRPTYGNLLYDEDDPRCWKDIQRFKPSYNLSQSQMMRLLTVCWIQGSRSTEILCSVQSPQTRPHLPSFVADWEATQKYDVLGSPDMGHLRRPDPSMMDLQVPYTIARVHFSPGARLLNIKGIEVAQVDAVGPTLDDIDDPRATLLLWYENMAATLWWRGIFASRDFDEIFWRIVIADVDERGNSPARYTREEFLHCSKYLSDARRSLAHDDVITTDPPIRPPSWLQARLRHASRGRRFITTSAPDTLFGIGPPETRIDDVLVTLSGSRIPFILRPTETDRDSYTLVGECYVYDIMRKEAKPTILHTKKRWFLLE